MSAAIDQAPDDEPFDELVVELYGQNQRSSGAIRQTFRWISFRNRETPPPYGSLRRAVEHRALMGIAFADIGLASSKAVAISVLDRGWEMYARPSPRGIPLAVAVENQAGEEESTKLIDALWQTLHTAHVHQMAHGDLRASEIRVEGGTILFGGYAYSEFGATEVQMQSDNAQLLFATASLFGVDAAVDAAIRAQGADTILAASGRLTTAALPNRIRRTVTDSAKLMTEIRDEVGAKNGIEKVAPAQVTRFSRNQLIQLVLLIGLVYVAIPSSARSPRSSPS